MTALTKSGVDQPPIPLSGSGEMFGTRNVPKYWRFFQKKLIAFVNANGEAKEGWMPA